MTEQERANRWYKLRCASYFIYPSNLADGYVFENDLAEALEVIPITHY